MAMDPNLVNANAYAGGTCPVCHQPVLASYFFCPNCGTKLQEPPLSTEPLTQLGLYAFSLILPIICYLLISKWQGLTYLRSKDEKARQVGAIACGLLVLSTALTFYYAYVWTQDAVQQATEQVNQDLSA